MSNCWDGCLETEINSVINCLWADYSSLLGVKLESSNDTCSLIFLDIIKVLSINDNFAFDIWGSFSAKCFNLWNNHFLIFFDSLSLDWFKNWFVLLSASDDHTTLHQLDQTLYNISMSKINTRIKLTWTKRSLIRVL